MARTLRPCAHCGKEFGIQGPRKFCSRECFGLANRTQVDVTCECCGKSFPVKVARVGEARFCSMVCRRVDVDQIRAMYDLGMSSSEVAAIVERNPASIRRIARQNGFGRSASDAMVLRWANSTPAEREHMVKAAHDTVRGSTHSLSKRTARAAAVADVDAYIGPHEVTFAGLLDARRITYEQQTACGPYNIDFTVAELGIAVEIVAGGGNERVRAQHQQRCIEVLNHWHLLEVQFHTHIERRLSPVVVDQLVAFGDLVTGLPPSPGKHRMVRADGQMISPRSAFNRYLASRA